MSSPKVRVRVLSESYGSPRDPVAKRGEIIEIERAEFDRSPGSFEDIAAAEQARVAAEVPTQDPWFMQQKEALRAEREAAAASRAIATEKQAERIAERAAEFRKQAAPADQAPPPKKK